MNNNHSTEESTQPEKTMEELEAEIEEINQENADIAERIHLLEKDLEHKKSEYSIFSKNLEQSNSPSLVTFFIILAISFWILLK